MRTACEKSPKTTKAPRKSQKYKSVPWWTQEVTAMRKTTNYLGENTREQETMKNKERKIERHTLKKSKNAATIKREKPNQGKNTAN